MRSWIRCVTYLVIVACTAGAAWAQQPATVGVSGHVAAAYRMDLVAVRPDFLPGLRVEQSSPSSVRILIPPGEPHGEREIRLVLSLRTNAATYRIVASSAVPEAAPLAEITLLRASPSGDGSQVASSAAANLRMTEAWLRTDQAVIAHGTRISTGGRFPAPNNALLAEFHVRFKSGQATDFLLALAP